MNPKEISYGLLRHPSRQHLTSIFDLLLGEFCRWVPMPFYAQERFRVGSSPMVFSRSVDRPPFIDSIPPIVCIGAFEEMLRVNAWREIASMARSVFSRVLASFDEQRNAVRSEVFSVEIESPISVGFTSNPKPAVSMGSIPWGFIHLGPESVNVSWCKGRNWSRIVNSHLISFADLLVRATCGANHSWPDLYYSTEVC